MMTFGSLFAGIGGLDLGLERAGMECRWQVELDGYASDVLARHWPDVPRFRDVREVGAANLEPVDIVGGGFPCQDISNAGKRAGIDGARSGLWAEFARIVRELRPGYVLVENVAALLGRGACRVLGDLAALGYDAEWATLRASDVGAPHRRERIFIVAYARSRERSVNAQLDGEPEVRSSDRDPRWQHAGRCRDAVADAPQQREREPHDEASANAWGGARASAGGGGGRLGSPKRFGLEGEQQGRPAARATERGNSDVGDAAPERRQEWRAERPGRVGVAPSVEPGGPHDWPPGPADAGEWAAYLGRHPGLEPAVRRGPHGLPRRMDRLRCLGNAVVPQIAEWIGRRILETEGA